MTTKNTNAVENYLKRLVILNDEALPIKPLALSKSLGVSPAAVTEMLKKLADDGLVTHSPYQPISLTTKGLSIGQGMVRRHRIWEMYLHQILGFPWDKVHQEAELLEHASSDELIDKLEELLNFPKYDPHGDPIPDKNGKMPKKKLSSPLSKIKENTRVQVIRVSDYDDEFLNYIHQIGIQLGTILVIQKIRKFDHSFEIMIDSQDQFHILSEFTAHHIYVQPIKESKS